VVRYFSTSRFLNSQNHDNTTTTTGIPRTVAYIINDHQNRLLPIHRSTMTRNKRQAESRDDKASIPIESTPNLRPIHKTRIKFYKSEHNKAIGETPLQVKPRPILTIITKLPSSEGTTPFEVSHLTMLRRAFVGETKIGIANEDKSTNDKDRTNVVRDNLIKKFYSCRCHRFSRNTISAAFICFKTLSTINPTQ
jgi:hypothetical protein